MPTGGGGAYASKRIYLLCYSHSLVVHVNDLHVEGVDSGEYIGGPLHHNLPAGRGHGQLFAQSNNEPI